MKSKNVAGLVAVTAVVIAGLLYASPYLAGRSIGEDINAKDAEILAEYVDFAALRESVKGHLLVGIPPELLKAEIEDKPLTSLGQILAASMVNQVADTLVSRAAAMLTLESRELGKSPISPQVGQGWIPNLAA